MPFVAQWDTDAYVCPDFSARPDEPVFFARRQPPVHRFREPGELVIHVLRRPPVGITQTGVRRERECMRGACTQHTLTPLPAFDGRIPDRFYRCYGYAKQAAAIANKASRLLQSWKYKAISAAAAELIEGTVAEHFLLAACMKSQA
jgi:hypothetical protein